MPAACLPCVLFAAFAGRLACVRIDQMQPPARKAGDALIDIAGPLGLVLVRSPTLHAEACVRAAVDEWRHSLILSGAKPAFLAQCQRRRPLQQRDAHPLASAGGQRTPRRGGLLYGPHRQAVGQPILYVAGAFNATLQPAT